MDSAPNEVNLEVISGCSSANLRGFLFYLLLHWFDDCESEPSETREDIVEEKESAGIPCAHIAAHPRGGGKQLWEHKYLNVSLDAVSRGD